jgi:ParB family chromosome partitioning protein
LSDAYQVFAPLSAAEQQALRDDIAARGIQVPIDVDQDGRVLDGHNRVAIAKALGITCPVIVHPYTQEANKFEHDTP